MGVSKNNSKSKFSSQAFQWCKLLVLCNLPKAEETVTEATSKPLRVLDLALQDSERDLSIRFNFVCNRSDVSLVIKQGKYRVFDFEVVSLGQQRKPLG